jgi:hypothetical protein
MADKKFEPHFDLTTATEISLYVRYWLDEYSDDSSKKQWF